MRRTSDWLPEKESDLADVFIPWIESSGWEVFQEVQLHYADQIADLVLRRGPVIWVVELKKSLSLDLLAQADAWLYYTNFVSVVVPSKKGMRKSRSSQFAKSILKDHGIGMFVIKQGFDKSLIVEEQIHPAFRRHNVSERWDFLHDGYKVSGKAGNSNGERWTAFKQTCWNMWSYLDSHPGASITQILDEITHHYNTTSTAKQCIFKYIYKKIIKGIRIDESTRPYKFYLQDGFDWRSEAKQIT